MPVGVPRGTPVAGGSIPVASPIAAPLAVAPVLPPPLAVIVTAPSAVLPAAVTLPFLARPPVTLCISLRAPLFIFIDDGSIGGRVCWICWRPLFGRRSVNHDGVTTGSGVRVARCPAAIGGSRVRSTLALSLRPLPVAAAVVRGVISTALTPRALRTVLAIVV